MSKRFNEENDSKNSSKRINYNIWKNKVVPITPPESPSSTNKYSFNIWNKFTDEEATKSITISDLKVGVCMDRPLIFLASFKSDKRGSKNGDMFIFHAMDGENEIQVTVFPQQTTKFFDVIELNHAYELVNFNVKKESKDFPLFVGEGVFLCLLTDSKINKVDSNLVPVLRFNFVNIETIKSLDVNSKCDCVAVIAKNWGQETVGQNKLKRELSLTDQSKECIVVTLWGPAYNHFDYTGTSVLIHNGVIKEYKNVKTITCSPNTLFWNDPDVECAKDLELWFNKEMNQ